MDISSWGNGILQFVNEKASFLINFLPISPFRRIIDHIGNIPYIPLSTFICSLIASNEPQNTCNAKPQYIILLSLH